MEGGMEDPSNRELTKNVLKGVVTYDLLVSIFIRLQSLLVCALSSNPLCKLHLATPPCLSSSAFAVCFSSMNVQILLD